MASPTPKKPGRPRKYLDDADRQAAHRERVAERLTEGEMLREIFDRPTPHLIRHLADKFAKGQDDKALAGALFAQALLEGLNSGGGDNCAQAAVNFIQFDYKRTGS